MALSEGLEKPRQTLRKARANLLRRIRKADSFANTPRALFRTSNNFFLEQLLHDHARLAEKHEIAIQKASTERDRTDLRQELSRMRAQQDRVIQAYVKKLHATSGLKSEFERKLVTLALSNDQNTRHLLPTIVRTFGQIYEGSRGKLAKLKALRDQLDQTYAEIANEVGVKSEQLRLPRAEFDHFLIDPKRLGPKLESGPGYIGGTLERLSTIEALYDFLVANAIHLPGDDSSKLKGEPPLPETRTRVRQLVSLEHAMHNYNSTFLNAFLEKMRKKHRLYGDFEDDLAAMMASSQDAGINRILLPNIAEVILTNKGKTRFEKHVALQQQILRGYKDLSSFFGISPLRFQLVEGSEFIEPSARALSLKPLPFSRKKDEFGAYDLLHASANEQYDLLKSELAPEQKTQIESNNAKIEELGQKISNLLNLEEKRRQVAGETTHVHAPRFMFAEEMQARFKPLRKKFELPGEKGGERKPPKKLK